MNKEELIGKLQMVYVGDKNALNEMIDYYDELFDEMESWKEDTQKYKEVIDKLENKIKIVKQYDFDRVGRYELLELLKDVE